MQPTVRIGSWHFAVWLILVMSIVSVIGGSCKLFGMDYVPEESQIRSALPELLVGGSAVEGLYGNHDVDCLIFRYRLSTGEKESPEAVLEKLQQSAAGEKWDVIDRKDTFLRLVRAGERGGGAFGIEEARIVFFPDGNKVYVAWLQADESKRVERMDEASEGKWAARHLWPKFEEYVNEERKGK
jgi:hypothetical protein